jgi:hypothetical protein
VKGDVVTYNHVALKYQARERLKGVRIQNPDDSQMNKAMDYILEVMSWKRAADAAIQ